MTDAPIPPGVGRALLAVFFALHYVSAMLTIGLSFAAAVAAWRGARRFEKDATAIAVVNVSVTIVLGVAALLFVSVVYTRAFFTSSLLLFPALMSVVPMLVVVAGSLYAAKWLPWLEPRPRGRGAALALAGVMAAGVGAVFAAIAALSWCRPGPEDDWMEMLVRSTWLARYAFELALAGAVTAACIVVRYGWDEEEDGWVREAGAAGVAFCAAAGATAFALASKLPVAVPQPWLAVVPLAALGTAFAMAALGHLRGRGAAVTVGAITLLLIGGLSAVREQIRSELL